MLPIATLNYSDSVANAATWAACRTA
ncbi:Hypothetical protein, partial CDS, partial [Neorhizobium galegae bv. orientalis]